MKNIKNNILEITKLKVVLFLEQGSIFDKAKKLRDHFFIERGK